MYKQKPIANTINTVYMTAYSEEGLYRIWDLCQDKEALKHVDSRTVIKANEYYPLTNISDNGDKTWSAEFIIERKNVRGNWKSDVSRVVQAAIGISGLQVEFRVETAREVVEDGSNVQR
jgi:hypothetical protein